MSAITIYRLGEDDELFVIVSSETIILTGVL